jgi:hypothetical protein
VDIRTERLRLVIQHPDLANSMVHFMRTNAAHFTPWDPPWPDNFMDPDWWR